jgi:photosystem II protein
MAKIQIFDEVEEKVIPLITLTKSLNGQTGTATFFFRRPLAFRLFQNSKGTFENINLVWEQQKIQTTDLVVHFYQGEPFLLEAVFIFLTKREWFSFFQFMTIYAKENGLAFLGTPD